MPAAASQMASGAQASPASPIDPATLSSLGTDQLTRSVDSQTVSDLLPLLAASNQEVPDSIWRSVARIQ